MQPHRQNTSVSQTDGFLIFLKLFILNQVKSHTTLIPSEVELEGTKSTTV